MQTPEGAHMDEQGHDLQMVDFSDALVRMNYLKELYAQVHAQSEYDPQHPDVFRTPGGFALEVATGVLPWQQVVDMVKAHPNTLVCCMDERNTGLEGNGVASHAGCGAAGLVAGEAAKNGRDNDVYHRLAEICGQKKLDAVLNAIEQGASTDEMGKLFSQTLAEAAGEPYRHLEVDAKEHYTNMTITDAAGLFEGNTEGQPGARAFVVSNTEFMGVQDRGLAFRLMVEYTALSLKIAYGDHSIMPKDRKYAITLTVRDEHDWDDFKRAWDENALAKSLDPRKYEIFPVTTNDLTA